MSIDNAGNSIIERALTEKNLSIFTDYYIRPETGGYRVFPGSIRFQQYEAYWKKIGKPRSFVASSVGLNFEVEPRVDEGTFIFFEKRGYQFLPWQREFEQSPQQQKIIIGTTGTGKTAGIGIMAMCYAAMTPNFRFLNVAPTLYQSTLMVRAIEETTNGTLFRKTFLLPGKQGFRERPYSLYRFANGSTCEFMNVENNARNVQSWSGDWINADEAGLNDQMDDGGTIALANMMIGLATRLRGVRPDGRPRLGWLTMVSMAYDNDALWSMYDIGVANPKTYYVKTVLHKDNPTLTPKDIALLKSKIPPGQEPQWLEGKRPAKKGAEFPSQIIDGLFTDEIHPAAYVEDQGPGITTYEVPPEPNHVYVIAGDPGMGDPPYRNAPNIQVWDVTDFPLSAARLAAFWWGYGNGSIMPFINKFDELRERYKVPESLRGYDSTSSQKAIAELAWSTGEAAVVPLSFDGAKKWQYINSVKILLSKGLLRAPLIAGFQEQIRNYKLPDKKLPQDIVSTLCMACHLMIPLYREAYPDEQEIDPNAPMAVSDAASMGRSYRPIAERHNGRIR